MSTFISGLGFSGSRASRGSAAVIELVVTFISGLGFSGSRASRGSAAVIVLMVTFISGLGFSGSRASRGSAGSAAVIELMVTFISGLGFSGSRVSRGSAAAAIVLNSRTRGDGFGGGNCLDIQLVLNVSINALTYNISPLVSQMETFFIYIFPPVTEFIMFSRFTSLSRFFPLKRVPLDAKLILFFLLVNKNRFYILQPLILFLNQNVEVK